MDRAIEKTLSARAVELGRAGEPVGLAELIDLLGKPSGEVRRLAVSAIGKLAGLADARVSVPALQARAGAPIRNQGAFGLWNGCKLGVA